VIRAIDLHSRQLVRSHGLTAPQALILKEIVSSGEISVGALAQRVSLSQATVTDILNRLEKRTLITRERSSADRRRVLVCPTPQANATIESGPPLLQEDFARRFSRLEDWEQTLLLASLQRIASLMDAQRLDASPVMTAGGVTASSELVEAMVDPEQASLADTDETGSS
jgi:DNA-binding MarR family transcriptional regulator